MQSGGASPMPPSILNQTVGGSANNSDSNTNGTSNAVPKTKICVYCGSSPGTNPVHMQAARDLAKVMAENDIGLGECVCCPPWQSTITLTQ